MNIKILLSLFLIIFLTSCQSSINRFTKDEEGADTYSSAELGKFSRVEEGIVIAIKKVKLSGSKALGAAVGGALISSVAQNAAGGSKDKEPASIVGGLLGALAGSVTEEFVTKNTGFEFLVKINGRIRSFVQKSDQQLKVGDAVYIIYGKNTVRLTLK